MRLKLIVTASIASVVLLSGCDRKATGQVAAVVNGEEITMQEINAELQGLQLPEGADKKPIMQAALQRIIDRRLLAAAAKEDGLDKDQEYVLRERQLQDALLAQMLNERASRGIQVPADSAIKTFIEQNPGAFGSRTIYTTDQIQFKTPANLKVLQAFEPDHTMEAVANRLRALGISFNRTNSQIDSMQVPKETLAQITSFAAGEPFVLPGPRVVTVSVITGSRSAPVAGDEARAVAVENLRNRQTVDLVQQRLKAERAKAKVEYQPGYAPPSLAKPN